jgi:hypothetical protein
MVQVQTGSQKDFVEQVSTLAWRSYRHAKSDSHQYLLGLAGQIVDLAQDRLAISRTAPKHRTTDTSQAVLAQVMDGLQRLLQLLVASTSKEGSRAPIQKRRYFERAGGVSH